jgi:processive 1,2-diacylglycerol beta-glucosyltransferase
MKKLRVVFPFVEAGFGHIMTERSICDAFEKKYGEYFEIVRSDFYKESGSAPMKKFEERMANEVRLYNKCHAYGYANIFTMNLFGSKISSWFVMEKVVKGAYADSMKHIEELNPDVLITTHWAVNYYAQKMANKPYTVMHVPDAHVNALFRYPCDFTTISMAEGYERARRFKRRYNLENLRTVPLAIRKEAFEITESKQELRQRWGMKDRFTIYVTEGGYGIGMAEELCKRLIEEDLPINVIMVCGKNPDLYERVSKLQSKGNLAFYPFGFCEKVLELIALSDLYLGKSGNGLMEAAFFGVPIVVTHSANTIEKLIAEHYVTYRKDAVRIFKLEKVFQFIKDAVEGGEKYRSLLSHGIPKSEFGGEGIADIIFAELDKKYHITENYSKEPQTV